MTTTTVTTNCYILRPGDFSKTYWQYDVITPDPRKKDRAVLIDRLQTMEEAQLFKRRAVFDGQKMLFSPTRLDTGGGAMSFNVSKYSKPRNSDGKGVYNIKLVLVGSVALADLKPLVSGQPTTTKSLVVLQLLNMLVRQAAIQSHPVHKGRSFYANPIDTELNKRGLGWKSYSYAELKGALELWSGAFQSVRPVLDNVIVNVDVSTACMYRQGPLIDVVLAFLGTKNTRDLDGMDERHRHWNIMKLFLKKLKVKVVGINKIRTIDSLQPRAGQYRFKLDSSGGERTMTVAEYYKGAHNIGIVKPGYPGIRTGPDAVIPFELCIVEPGQFYRKRLSPDNTTTMLNFTKKRPNERMAAIEIVRKNLRIEGSDYIREANLNIANRLLEVSAHLLPTPRVLYDGTNEMPSKGSWNLLKKRFIEPGEIECWAILMFQRLSDQQVGRFRSDLELRLNNLGVRVLSDPLVRGGNGQSAMAELDAICAALSNKYQMKKPPLIIVILPQTAAALRKSVKVWGDTIRGVPTQIVRHDKVTTAQDQYFNNLALKINAKIGGFASILDSEVMNELEKEPFMILGADVNHPGPGVNRPSIASLVNTVNYTATAYFASVSVQEPRTEIIQDLGKMFYQAMQQFYKFHHKPNKPDVFPSRIILYRDGVSDGEFENVAKNEIEVLENTTKVIWKEAKLNPSTFPKFTFIIVGKRHHVRFFPIHNGDKDNSGNLKAGFVVDSTITSSYKNMPDFYLQSHSGLLGTSRPSHYTVLKDDSKKELIFWQKLSNDLCYLYARCTRSVSIPAPVYYADICCARADFHFDELNFDSDSSTEGEFDLERWKRAFKGPLEGQARHMYFM